MLFGICIGLLLGWLIPSPMITFSGDGKQYSPLVWAWNWTRDKFGMN